MIRVHNPRSSVQRGKGAVGGHKFLHAVTWHWQEADGLDPHAHVAYHPTLEPPPPFGRVFYPEVAE